jgi:hypothetical protein
MTIANALVRSNVRFAPKTTIRGMGPKWRDVPIAEIANRTTVLRRPTQREQAHGAFTIY